MKRFLGLTIVCLVVACMSCTSRKENQTNEERDSTKTNPQKQDTVKSANWIGTWTYTDNAPIEYTLVIGNQEQEMFVCTYEATGVQTSYKLDCLGLAKGNKFELYYQGVAEGAFMMEDKINRDNPVLTLASVDGNILTDWNQLINNYVEQGNRSGTVCFEKK